MNRRADKNRKSSPNILPMTAHKTHSLYQISPILGGCLIMTSSGSVYLVAAYSSKLQMLLGMTTGEVSTFGTMIAAGSWLGIIPYTLTDWYGPKVTIFMGAIMLTSGYFAIAMAASGMVDFSPSAVIMCGFFIGFGSSWTHASALVTNASNTALKQRGTVIGILQANFALSSGVYTQFLQVFELDIPSFLTLTGSLMCLSILTAYPLNNRIVGNEDTPMLQTDPLFILPLACLTSLTAGLLATASTLRYDGLHYCVIASFAILFVTVAFLSIKMLFSYKEKPILFTKSFDKLPEDEFELSECSEAFLSCGSSRAHRSAAETTSLIDKQHKYKSIESTKSMETDVQHIEVAHEEKEDEHTTEDDHPKDLMACVFTTSFWVIFVCYVVGVGSGLTVLDNVSKIIDAHSAKDSDDDVHSTLKTSVVALFSAFNCAGRISYGFASDWLAAKFGISRTWMLSFNCLLMAVGMVMMAYLELSMFIYAIMFIATCYGGFLMLIPTLVADLFGFKNYGSILGLMNFAPMMGTELFYNILSSYIYERHLPEGELTCYDNTECFRTTFLTLSVVCMLASVFAAIAPPPAPSPPKIFVLAPVPAPVAVVEEIEKIP